MIEIEDLTKASPERVTPRPLQRRLQWTAPVNPINQIITTHINISSLARHFPDQQGGASEGPAERIIIECCASGYPELKSLH